MDDRRIGQLRLELEHARPAELQAPHERVAPFVVLGEEQGEVGREALAQPHVVPVVLGDRIAPPLVRDLVDDRRASGGDALLAVEDRAGVLGAAAHAGGLHVGDLLVRVRADLLHEEGHRAPRQILEDPQAGVAVLRKRPRLQLDALHHAGMVHRESGDPQRVEPRGNRHRLPPVREAACVGQITLLDEQPVGHDLVLRRSGDDELAGRLVVRVVDRRQPLARAIGPVLAEDHALAMDVVDEPQALGGHTGVGHRERHFRAFVDRSPAATREADRTGA